MNVESNFVNPDTSFPGNISRKVRSSQLRTFTYFLGMQKVTVFIYRLTDPINR